MTILLLVITVLAAGTHSTLGAVRGPVEHASPQDPEVSGPGGVRRRGHDKTRR